MKRFGSSERERDDTFIDRYLNGNRDYQLMWHVCKLLLTILEVKQL